ncbi:Cell division inhibitor [Desulfurella amilsii]|uniref:Cell division inhibitor n=1 Tax=Desulfurella amilsii TaxID=1562698 RepID=A0A1X4XV13_9BACT|nr:TIGR01777 family oxidoreductase [Desulfurella amilsii]OSS41371.1 Cell division inhibitor [Desulfurella amilsii]
MNILITGGSGLIGKKLSRILAEKGHNVAILSRKQETSNYKVYTWNIEQNQIDLKAIEESDCIVHLAGANIGEKPWSSSQKELILKSRIDSANLLFETAKKISKSFKCVVSASAVGCYGAVTSNHVFKETDPYGNDFLGSVCKNWEAAIEQFQSLDTRVVKLRTAMVLDKDGGALTKIIKPVKLGLASALGSGRQYVTWIHIDDLVNIYVKAIEDQNLKGAYNCASMDQKANKEFMQTLAKTFHKPFWPFNAPSLVLKSLYGEMADILLEGSRVDISKILSTGFKFQYNYLEDALKSLYINV